MQSLCLQLSYDSHGHMIWLSSSTTHFIFFISSTSTSSGHGFLPSRLVQTFILEECGLIAVLPKLSCDNFQLTLIIGDGSNKRCLENYLCFRHTPHYSHYIAARQFLLDGQNKSPSQNSNPRFCLLI